MGISAQKNAKKCVERLASNASSGFIWCYSLVEPSSINVDNTGFFKKKQPSCQTHCEETCTPPFPQFNVVTSLCLERLSKKNRHFGSDAGMHWATTLIKGAWGDQVWCDNM